ncbi:MAG: N-acetylmuramoyl-L-alanine amidase [Cetobacterium sp.]|uniref:N-acetylmuramoyl-L-alanine amidase family protein n=1 Tax=Cetobacterium sp. ZOR0034 TaxID=1339239 RepID=UPI000648654F|nr:N-acetylmuramoyl-L-alanine amidase [Cetobacterium sp. ZOR0034]
MKKYLIFLMVCLFSLTIFANGTIQRVRMNNNPAQLVFDISSQVKPKFNSNYDEYNRLLFLEIEKVKMNTKFNPSSYIGKSIEKIDLIDYGTNVGFFIKLKKGAGHKVYSLANPHRIVVDLRPTTSSKKEFTIAIDAGHGGKDPGAIGFKKYKEKDIALAVAKKLQTRLSKDFNVIMTRNTDVYLTLSERSRIANRAKADLFVSLHLNASNNASAQGAEIFYFSKKSSPYAEKIAAYENSFGEKYGEKTGSIAQIMGELAYNKNMEKSINIAKPLNSSLAKRLNLRDRGIYGANFAVLRGFNGPGILVELGFITNKDDVTKLSKDANQNVMADELANKIRSFFY